MKSSTIRGPKKVFSKVIRREYERLFSECVVAKEDLSAKRREYYKALRLVHRSKGWIGRLERATRWGPRIRDINLWPLAIIFPVIWLPTLFGIFYVLGVHPFVGVFNPLMLLILTILPIGLVGWRIWDIRQLSQTSQQATIERFREQLIPLEKALETAREELRVAKAARRSALDSMTDFRRLHEIDLKTCIGWDVEISQKKHRLP